MRNFLLTLALLGSPLLHASDDVEAPFERHSFDLETGGLWHIGNNTQINYQLIQNQISWRSPYVFKVDLNNGSTIAVRNHFSLMGTWVSRGPEDYYFGLSGSPSIEWWSPSYLWSVYFSIGGGFGFTNSTNVPGGQGQDFTYNWFTKAGVRHQLTEDFAIFGGPFFMHMSNRGATDPNPGIDALGFTIGTSFSF